jgi:hypothetical protein
LGGFGDTAACWPALPFHPPQIKLAAAKSEERHMKILAAILFGGALMAAPALAQDNGAGKDDMAKKPEAHHMMHHAERYKRDYKTDKEEHQATEDLNKQYRGVNAADVH